MSAIRPLSLGGGPLHGDRFVRMVYLDESGISTGEPYLVVSGTIIHADKQWKAVEKYLHDMRDELTPPNLRKDCIFHATDLFHGTKKFHRDRWPKERRFAILDELVSIPAKFDLPLICGFVRKCEFRERLRVHNLTLPRSLAVNAQAVAFTISALAANSWMEVKSERDEVALLIAEDNKEARAAMKSMINFNRDPANMHLLDESSHRYLPLTRIVDTAHFAEKLDSSPLQIADVCAFSIMRRLRRGDDCQRFYAPLEPNLVIRPNLAKLDLIGSEAAYGIFAPSSGP